MGTGAVYGTEDAFAHCFRYPAIFIFVPSIVLRIGKACERGSGVKHTNQKKQTRPPKKGAKKQQKRHVLDNLERLSVIVEVCQDERTIKQQLEQIERLYPKEILLIVHGSNPLTIDSILSRESEVTTAFVYPFFLGRDVWRSIGAREARGDVWLFLDGGTVIPAEELQRFVSACYHGLDVALRENQHPPDLARAARSYLNLLLDQSKLTTSMIDLPFAITRTAAERIGVRHLLIPPLAHAIAVKNRLRVESTGLLQSTDQLLKKKGHSGRKKRLGSLQQQKLLLGDHLEAVRYVASIEEGTKER